MTILLVMSTKCDENVMKDALVIAKAVRVHLAEDNCSHNIRDIVRKALEID